MVPRVVAQGSGWGIGLASLPLRCLSTALCAEPSGLAAGLIYRFPIYWLLWYWLRSGFPGGIYLLAVGSIVATYLHICWVLAALGFPGGTYLFIYSLRAPLWQVTYIFHRLVFRYLFIGRLEVGGLQHIIACGWTLPSSINFVLHNCRATLV